MCFGSSKSKAPQPLQPPPPVHDVIEVDPLPATASTGPTASAAAPQTQDPRTTSSGTGLNIPT